MFFLNPYLNGIFMRVVLQCNILSFRKKTETKKEQSMNVLKDPEEPVSILTMLAIVLFS
jgi:hypothetical protein